MAKTPIKNQPSSPAPSSSSEEESPSPSTSPVKKLSRERSDLSLEPTDDEVDDEEESSEENSTPKRIHPTGTQISRNTDDDANNLKLEKLSAATKTLARTVSMDQKLKEYDSSSESEEEESKDEESSEDSGSAARQSKPMTRLQDSQFANDGKNEVWNTSSSSDSGREDVEEDRKELSSRSKSVLLLPFLPSQPARNATNPIADPSLKPEGGEAFTEDDKSSEDFANTTAKEKTRPHLQESQNKDGDKQASDSFSFPGSGLGNGEEEIETPISASLLDPLSCQPIGSIGHPVEKESNFRKQSDASLAQISRKKKRNACIFGVEGGHEKERFKRIWSNEDELALLQGILEYKERHHIIPYSHMHAKSLLKSVKESLSISISVNQINDKVRRMKRRYNNTTARQSLAKKSKISDPHNAAVFDLSKKIWDSLKEESIFLENKIMLEEKENINKKKRHLTHFTEKYPYLCWHLKSEHANNALVLQNHMPFANAKMWEEKCKKLEKIDNEVNMLKIELLSSAVKLIQDAISKC